MLNLLAELAYMIRHPRKWYANLQAEFKKVDEAVQRSIAKVPPDAWKRKENKRDKAR